MIESTRGKALEKGAFPYFVANSLTNFIRWGLKTLVSSSNSAEGIGFICLYSKLTSQAWYSWNEDTIHLLISYVSWTLANIMSESSHSFKKWDRNSGSDVCIMVCLKFCGDYYMLRVMAAHHCYS
jgi:hypothetical protein